MTWTCDQIEARISDYLEGMLQGPERAGFEAHAETCAECAPLLASVRSLVNELRAMEELETPPRLVYSILDNTLGPRETVTMWQAFRNFVLGMATPKFAYGAASVMATFVILVGASGISLRKPKLAELRPATMMQNVSKQAHRAYAGGERYVSQLRVVYEIQSRLRQENELQAAPEENTPKSTPEKQPGQSDDHTRTQPKQQNRANELARQVQMLAAECPVVLQRSFR
ncbi:MAG: zf-HC2 domain-containing protein [Candidatus Acidiferrum sp.]